MNLTAPVIAGNWKLHHGPSRTESFLRALLPELDHEAPGTVALFPPAVSLTTAAHALDGADHVLLGAQNIFWEAEGAFTGEISGAMAREAGAHLTLVGHSERRHIFGETVDDTVRKVRAAIDAGLVALLCVGETLEEREAGHAADVVRRQLDPVLANVQASELSRFLIAYEPVWAIGTGRTATPDDAAEMHAHVRDHLVAHHGEGARHTPILYGGSVKPGNARELLAAPEVGGLLIGGASLEPDSFAEICRLRS